MNTLGEKIRHFRKSKGFTQEDLAHELDISLPAYSKIERNITDINYSRLLQVAKALNISLLELITEDNKNDNFLSENDNLKKQISEKNKEIIQLQRKVIILLEQSKKTKASKKSLLKK